MRTSFGGHSVILELKEEEASKFLHCYRVLIQEINVIAHRDLRCRSQSFLVNNKYASCKREVCVALCSGIGLRDCDAVQSHP